MSGNMHDNPQGGEAGPSVSDPRHLSPADWARFGVAEVAYIRPALVNGVRAFAIHAADGTAIGAAPNAQLAMAAIRQHEMEPLLLH